MFRALLPSLKATCFLALAVIIVFLSARTASLVDLSALYTDHFQFVPAHWMRYRLNTLRDPAKTCLLVGTSVVRIGFNSETLGSGNDIQFVNIATTGGYASADVLDLESAILANLGARYRCILVGVNNFYVYRFSETSYELESSDYLSQLPVKDIATFLAYWPHGSLKQTLLPRLILPLGQQAIILQRWWRYGLFRGRHFLNPEVVQVSYELFPGEFDPAVQYEYDDKPPLNINAVLEQKLASFHQLRLLDPTVYQDAKPAQALVRALRRLSDLTDHLFVVRMPLTSAYDEVEKAALPAFNAAIAEAPHSLIVSCKFPKDRERALYYDLGHLNPVGRQIFSSIIRDFILLAESGRSAESYSDVCYMLNAGT